MTTSPHSDDDLRRVTRAWKSLPPHIRNAITVMAEATIGVSGLPDAQMPCMAIAREDDPTHIEEVGHFPLANYVDSYISFVRDAGQSPAWVVEKEAQLRAFVSDVESDGRSTLDDLDRQTLLRFMNKQIESGKSPATANTRRRSIVAWAAWLESEGIVKKSPFFKTPKLDERGDRRRHRRCLTDEEVDSLLRVADKYGRGLWYRLPLFAGLRLGDMVRLDWKHIDLDARVITIMQGKSGRVDHVPIFPELLKHLVKAQSRGRVFKTCVTNKTRVRDYERAGIALRDDRGMVADLHCLRTTLATKLARAGAPPATVSRIMRHADIQTTMLHYTFLVMDDMRETLDGALACWADAGRAA